MTAPALRDPRLLTDAELATEADALLQLDNAHRIASGHRQWATPGAMARALEPEGFSRTTRALDLLDRELVALADGDTRKLIWSMPSQEGKSQRAVRRFVTWLLSSDPTLRIGIVSYEKYTAMRWGRTIRQDILRHPELGIALAKHTRRQDEWETEQGGGVICVGIGGAITGRPLDVLVIDDPVKGRAWAESLVEREKAYAWWESDASTRQSSRFRCLVVMTRWQEDDLAGRLMAREPGEWRHVNVPAIAGDNDPLGREPGEELDSVQNRPPDYFYKRKSTLSPYVFGSIYQGNPVAAEGNMFKRADWRFWRNAGADVHGVLLGLGENAAPVALANCWRFGTVDSAASKRSSADYTVVSAWAFTQAGDLILLDRYRGRLGESEHIDAVRPLVQRWGLDTTFLEKSFISSTLAYDLGSAGIPLSPLDADTDKITRAVPYANRVSQHRVYLPAEAPWLDEWLDEHAQFPNAGAHDDQVDTGSYATRVVGTQFAPFPLSSGRQPGMPAVPLRENGHRTEREIDLGRQQW